MKTKNVRGGTCAALPMAAAAATCAAEPARPASGFAPTLTVAGRLLVLEGWSTRYKASFRVHDAASAPWTSMRTTSGNTP